MEKAKILLIDDDQEMIDLARFFLQSDGHEVTTARSAMEALRLAEANRFQLGLTDLVLPDLDGIELVERLKATSPSMEIIMMSAHGSVAKAVEATKAGAFYFVE